MDKFNHESNLGEAESRNIPHHGEMIDTNFILIQTMVHQCRHMAKTNCATKGEYTVLVRFSRKMCAYHYAATLQEGQHKVSVNKFRYLHQRLADETVHGIEESRRLLRRR